MSSPARVIAFGALFVAAVIVAAAATVVGPMARRSQIRLEPVVGRAATDLALTSTRWYVTTFSLGWGGLIPLGVWAQMGGPRVVWLAAALAAVAAGLSLSLSLRAGRRSGRAASAYVSAQRGYRLAVGQPRGFSPRQWQLAIDGAERARATLLGRAERDGAQRVVEQEVARWRRAQTSGMVAAGLLGAIAGMVVGLVAAQPAWNLLAAPFFLLGAASGAIGLPLWARSAYEKARARRERDLWEQLSERAAESGQPPALTTPHAPGPPEHVRAGASASGSVPTAPPSATEPIPVPRAGHRLSTFLTSLLTITGVALAVAGVWPASLALLLAAAAVFLLFKRLSADPRSRVDAVSQAVLEDWSPVVTPGQFVVGAGAVAVAFLLGVYSQPRLSLANGWVPAGTALGLAVVGILVINWSKRSKTPPP